VHTEGDRPVQESRKGTPDIDQLNDRPGSWPKLKAAVHGVTTVAPNFIRPIGIVIRLTDTPT
jgi:hypothetical protein